LKSTTRPQQDLSTAIPAPLELEQDKMIRRAVLVSLRFNPAIIQHLVAYSKALQALGFTVEAVLDAGYREYLEPGAMTVARTEPGDLESASFSHAIFFNVSIHNLALAIRLKRTGARIIYIYHEPWEASFAFLRTDGFGIRIKAAMAHRVSRPLLKVADLVLLGSQYGLSAYRQADARYNPSASFFPLIYDDEIGRPTEEIAQQKVYFSYLGNIGRVHGFDQFIRVMRESLLRKSNIRFIIASRFPLPDFVMRDEVIRRNLDKIDLMCGRTLTNEEINGCYARSFGVWNLYRRSMQSGVLPKAFMHGTPVVASRIGSFPEYVRDGFNGRFASADDRDDVLSVLDEIQGRSAEYAVNCRRSFLETFFYKSKVEDLRRLLV
jgi:glycosyltransferase involved in cell wall biosynthesis